MLHLGGRYFLATTQGELQLSTGPLQISPLTIYNFPCNVSFYGMKTGLTRCPDRLEITVPLFKARQFQYVPWQKYLDHNLLNLHYESLKIPPAETFNKSLLNAIVELYKTFDKQLSVQIKTAGVETT